MLLPLLDEIISCEKCPRLITHCRHMAAVKRRAFRDQEYWGKPVPSFGDPAARLLVLGLAPAAHGANRTGRIFTGDRSGDFLYRALHETGFANQAGSTHRGDGLSLQDVWIASSVRCAPPDNKPTTEEVRTCRPYLEREIPLLPNLQGVIVLGRLAFDVYLSILRDQSRIASRAAFSFGHNTLHAELMPWLLCSYHPSQQNTSTGRLTKEMLRAVFDRAQHLLV